MTIRPATRPMTQVRRRSARVRRRSAGLTPVRAGAPLAMIGAGLAIYGLASSPVFGLDRLAIHGATLTSEQTVGATLAVARGTNLVTLDTAALEARLETLPTVRDAEVAAGLPGILSVRVEERRPILVWISNAGRLLVDVEGHVVAVLPNDAPIPHVDERGRPLPAGSTTGRPLPVIGDDRAFGGPTRVGDVVDPVELDVARRLGSLRPEDVGSAMPGLSVRISVDQGFVVRPTGEGTAGWVAGFGFYTASDDIRSPVIVPDQVRLLRSLLTGREDAVGRVRLASATDGTFVPRPSPSPSATP